MKKAKGFHIAYNIFAVMLSVTVDSSNYWWFKKFYTTAEAMDFKFGIQLGFAKAHHKTTPRENVGVALG